MIAPAHPLQPTVPACLGESGAQVVVCERPSVGFQCPKNTPGHGGIFSLQLTGQTKPPASIQRFHPAKFRTVLVAAVLKNRLHVGMLLRTHHAGSPGDHGSFFGCDGFEG